MTANDLAGMTFAELTVFMKQQAALATTRCPGKAAELGMIVRVLEERGPGDANQTRQYIADTLNACVEESKSTSAVVLAGIGLLAWLLLR